MNEQGFVEDVHNSKPSLVPLLRWCEEQSIVPKGTTEHVNMLADKVKGLGEALRAAGVKRA